MQNFGRDWTFNQAGNNNNLGASILNSYMVAQQRKLEEEHRRKLEEEARRKKDNDWLSGLLTVGGSLLGNILLPGLGTGVGAMLGGTAGGAIGRNVGGYDAGPEVTNGLGKAANRYMDLDTLKPKTTPTAYNPWNDMMGRYS